MNENTIAPLEGEPEIPGLAPQKTGSNRKKLIAIAILLLSMIAVLSYAVKSYFTKTPQISDKAITSPDVASAQAPSLKMPPPEPSRPPAASAVASTSSAAQSGTTVPSLQPLPGEPQAIAVQGTGGSTGGARASSVKVISPDDAPLFSSGAAPDTRASTTANAARGGTSSRVAEASASLDTYQRQLNGMLENLQNLTAGNAQPGGASPITAALAPAAATPQPPASPLFGSMDRSATPTVLAKQLGDRNMIVPKGTLFLCGLKTRVVSATSGFIGCQVTRNVFSDNGRVLLIERGSHMDGEYRIVSVRPGVTRIPVLWTRIRTPQGVTVDLDSPATGPLGESGLGGYVDNRWGERLGAALMLSLVNDALKYAIASQQSNGSDNTVLLPNTADQGSKLAEKVLETTINIPPIIYQNQGGVVGVYVARDLDFASVYELKPQ